MPDINELPIEEQEADLHSINCVCPSCGWQQIYEVDAYNLEDAYNSINELHQETGCTVSLNFSESL